LLISILPAISKFPKIRRFSEFVKSKKHNFVKRIKFFSIKGFFKSEYNKAGEFLKNLIYKNSPIQPRLPILSIYVKIGNMPCKILTIFITYLAFDIIYVVYVKLVRLEASAPIWLETITRQCRQT